MTHSFDDKICILTGATSGIGKCAAFQLAKQGWTVGMVCRNEESGKQTLQSILDAYPQAKVDLFSCDLSSQNAIRSLARTIKQKYAKIDALIHNAGIISSAKQLTSDQLEFTFAVNHLAPFLLTSLLMPSLEAATEAKIILLTSKAEELGKIDFENLQGEKKFHWAHSYAQSKLANLLFCYELSKRVQKNRISVLALHPGATQSKLGRNLTGAFGLLFRVLQPLIQSPEKAASFLVELLKLPYSSEPRYFVKSKLGKSSKRSYDAELGSKLWTISETLTQTKN